MKIIFLDIDGVMNSNDWTRRRGPGDEGLTPRSRGVAALDPDAVLLLGELVERSGASLVLSSTWRLDGGVAHTERLLALRGLRVHGQRVHFIGQIPDGSRMINRVFGSVTRGHEIAMWLRDHASMVDGAVIIDDERSMGELTPWLVQTTMARGLQREHVEQALTVLARDREDLRLAVIDQLDEQGPAR